MTHADSLPPLPPALAEDHTNMDAVLRAAHDEALGWLRGLDARPAAGLVPATAPEALPEQGQGLEAALAAFRARYAPHLSGGAGPRYYGFVTGGATPAAIAGDWLTSAYDQNASGSSESIAPALELETLAMLRELLGLPADFHGSFVSGATMSNFAALAVARQWFGKQFDMDIAQRGLTCMRLRVASGTPHSSGYKALAMLGIGRDALHRIECLPGREAIDLAALEVFLRTFEGEPSIVIASAGTVNSVDFDDLEGLARLREKYGFWLHVDGAFGAFAACSPATAHHVRGIDKADSVTVDAHKYLNVPYDSAMMFTRHLDLQRQVFANAAVYLQDDSTPADWINRTPENSRRLRALPAWFTLKAYGREGTRAIVERTCALARRLAGHIEGSGKYRLLAPVRLNGVVFTLEPRPDLDAVRALLLRVQADGRAYFTPTSYLGVPGIRASISNWRTTEADIDRAWSALEELAG